MADVEITQVEKLKALLGITDTDKDVLVEFALENADIYRNEQMGSVEVPQSVSSVTVGDTSTSFKTSGAEFSESIMKNYKAVLNRYRRVEFS